MTDHYGLLSFCYHRKWNYSGYKNTYLIPGRKCISQPHCVIVWYIDASPAFVRPFDWGYTGIYQVCVYLIQQKKFLKKTCWKSYSHFNNKRSFSNRVKCLQNAQSRHFISRPWVKVPVCMKKICYGHCSTGLNYRTLLTPQLLKAWWRHMATWMWVNIGAGNDLLPDGTKRLLKQMLDFSLMRSCGIHLTAISQRLPKLILCKIDLKIKLLK